MRMDRASNGWTRRNGIDISVGSEEWSSYISLKDVLYCKRLLSAHMHKHHYWSGRRCGTLTKASRKKLGGFAMHYLYNQPEIRKTIKSRNVKINVMFSFLRYTSKHIVIIIYFDSTEIRLEYFNEFMK